MRALRWLLENDDVDERTVRTWRLASHWNNDWDLVYGLYCWRVGAPQLSAADASRLTLDELARRAAGRARWSYDEARGVFEELYSGTPAAVARWRVRPVVHNDHPLSDDESIALRAELLDELRALGISKFGVVTGRALYEWRNVADRIPLGSAVAVATDEDGRKPDPAPLVKVVSALRPRGFVSVGDTMSDLLMVRAYNASHAPAGVPVVLCPEDEEPRYRAAGAEHFIRGLDELPRVIRLLAR